MRRVKLNTFLLMLVLTLGITRMPVTASAGLVRGQMKAPIALSTPQKETGLRLALADLARDCRNVLGGEAAVNESLAGDIVVRIDPAIAGAEGWRIEISGERIRITGSDELGAIYGIYQFSQQFLGVDPFWFWKDRKPANIKSIALKPQVMRSTPPTFRYRGWFVNDEDLLTEWVNGGGQRHIRYPFYAQVIHPDVADRIFETLLRAGGNLIIPASFVDVMNPPEAALVKRAAERGLYVTQHHIEPLGVHTFCFENYWKARGQILSMSYSTQPDKVRETWRAYARKWRELAGDRVIWQLGLRGSGDRPVWTSDKGVKKEDAGGLIGRAMTDQWRIVREVDPRSTPPATTTLWAEGSELMRQGELTIPPDVIVVFSDEGASQEMQEDFYKTARRPETGYGVYYHIAFWAHGPHLVQGVRPEKIKRVFDEIVAKGDTAYAIINVCNIREHVLGVQAASELMTAQRDWDAGRFMERFAPEALRPLYQAFWNSYVPLSPARVLQDGYLCHMTAEIRKAIATSVGNGRSTAAQMEKPRTYAKLCDQLRGSIARLDRLIRDYPADKLSAEERDFFDVNLLTQAKMLRGLYQYMDELLRAAQDRRHLADAEAALTGVLEARQRAERGQWANWYRGDKKMNLPKWLEETKKLKHTWQNEFVSSPRD